MSVLEHAANECMNIISLLVLSIYTVSSPILLSLLFLHSQVRDLVDIRAPSSTMPLDHFFVRAALMSAVPVFVYSWRLVVRLHIGCRYGFGWCLEDVGVEGRRESERAVGFRRLRVDLRFEI